ncbi:MAG: methyl-accepting chemotaxis protein [Pseudohongiellaceae bacterium]
MMNSEQIELVQESWAKITDAGEAAEVFYETLFKMDPTLEVLFSDDMSAQGKKLMEMIGIAVGMLDQLDKLVPIAKKLGERHQHYGVTDEHYDTVGAALIQTLEVALESEFTGTVEEAWLSVYQVLANTMRGAAKENNMDSSMSVNEESDMSTDDAMDGQRFERMVDSVRTAIMLIDKDLIVTYVNEGTKRLISENLEHFKEVFPGFDGDNIVGACIDAFHKNPAHQRQILANPANLPHEAEIRVGPLAFSLYISASYDAHGAHDGSILEWANVTKEKDRYADFSSQIEAISKSQAVIEFNMDGTVVTANENFLNTFGYQLSEVVGQHHSMFVSAEYKSSADYRIFWEKLNRGEFDTGEYERFGKNQKQVWIQASYNPIFDLNGKPCKLVKYATDISGRKQAIANIKDSLIAVADGDLTQKIEGKLEGEFNVLGDSMNALIKNLNNMVAEIRNGSNNVFSAAREIAQGNDDLSKRTESQASSLEETASAMEELTTTVQQNAQNATEATKLAQSVMTKACSGGEVVTSAVTAMEEINSSSKKIADIIGVIDEIAFQTNLLALNAAVEAARAGEQGRGFAVVAAEVRNLAGRSAAAAKEIKGLISDSVDAVGKGTKLVDESGQTFTELTDAVGEVEKMIADIDNASNEQASGINEVSQAVAQMDEMTQQNAALVEQSAASSKSMEDQAQSLIEQVDFFKTDESQGRIPTNVTSLGGRESSPVPRRAALGGTSSSDDEWQEF